MSLLKGWLSGVLTLPNRRSRDNQSNCSMKNREIEKIPQKSSSNALLNIEKKLKKSTINRLSRSESDEIHEDESVEEAQQQACEKTTRSCVCSNCTALPLITECGVCLEPLQCREIRSCIICSNLTCKKCSLRLQLCAFCRSDVPLMRNRAVERIFERLILPCRNYRNGCAVLLNSERRLIHESQCIYTLACCPAAAETCHWNGSLSGILKHLKIIHNLSPLTQSGVTVSLTNFRMKASSQGEFIIYLNCYSQLFKFKIVLSRKKLYLLFTHIGYIAFIPDNIPLIKYAYWINVCGGDKKFQGIVPLDRAANHQGSRKIEINCQSLLINNHSDSVRIQLGIKKND